VDDSALALRFLASRLQPWGLAVECVSTSGQAVERLAQRNHDLIFIDVELGAESELDGLALCQEIKRRIHAPAVVLYAATTPDALVVAGIVAGADAVVGKSSSAGELLEAIREVARAPRALPPISRQMTAGAAERLDPADHAILAMRLAGESGADIGTVLGLSPSQIADRVRG